MEMLEQLAIIGNETPAQAEAISLHYEIVAAAKTAANSLLDLGRKLKRMRDTGHYKDLGFESFADYTEQAVGIRQRQAYNYIGVVEKLPAQLIEENAAAGVTKLALLAKLGPTDREEVAGELANITVTELEKLIEEKNGLTEQLTMLQEEKPADQGEEKEYIVYRCPDGSIIVDWNEDTWKYGYPTFAKEKCVELERGVTIGGRYLPILQTAMSAKYEQKTGAGNEEELERIKADARAAAIAEAQKQHAEEVKTLKAEKAAAEKTVAEKVRQAKKEAEQLTEQKIERAKKEATDAAAKAQAAADKAEIEKAQLQAQQAQQRAEEIAKQMKLQSNAEGTRFALLFDDVQQKVFAIIDMVDKMTASGKEDEAAKFSTALAKALRALADQAEGGKGW